MTATYLLILVGSVLPAQVVLRTGERIDAPASMNAQGVAFEKSPTIPGVLGSTIGWDRVKAVLGEAAPGADKWTLTADKAWRARTRLERSDAASAEPLFEELFAEYSARTGPTAAMIDQGLLTCRLYRGAQLTAILPWLCWLRCGTPDNPLPTLIDLSRASGPGTIGIAVAPDRANGLVPQLPPIFIDTPALQAFARSEPSLALAPDEVPGPFETRARALWEWYLFAARNECKLEAARPGIPAGDEALLLVSQIVLARSGDTADREKARSALRDRLAGEQAPWQEAWCRAALGRSLAASDSPEERLLGIVELLHVPARFADQSSYLTGLALAESAVALKDVGDLAGADRLHAELIERFAGHPATDWTPVRAWPVSPAQPPKTDEEGT